MEGLS